ncbi:MAG: hypothetical protein H6711_24815 [Myxococcales bacterium]|nr:hypothetical protein [Myxococcales bacterium]
MLPASLHLLPLLLGLTAAAAPATEPPPAAPAAAVEASAEAPAEAAAPAERLESDGSDPGIRLAAPEPAPDPAVVTTVPPVSAAKAPPKEYGPFFEPEPPSDTAHPGDPPRDKPPLFSVGKGAFCFVEDAACTASLIASGDVAVGVLVPAGDRGVDIPLTQWGFRGGLTVRPVALRRRAWHPWTVGLVGSFVRSSGAVASTASTIGASNPDLENIAYSNGMRVALLNQLWLSQRRNALHFDVALGVVRSHALTDSFKSQGLHADFAFGVGGWGSLFLAGDFLRGDTRLAFGFRGHGIGAAPIAALVVLGLLAGGAL